MLFHLRNMTLVIKPYMYSAAPFALMGGSSGHRRPWRVREDGDNMIALGEQQAMMQAGDAPVTPGHGG